MLSGYLFLTLTFEKRNFFGRCVRSILKKFLHKLTAIVFRIASYEKKTFSSQIKPNSFVKEKTVFIKMLRFFFFLTAKVCDGFQEEFQDG